MVQLHAVRAGVPETRVTVDVDMIVHIETGAATFGGVRGRLEQLGYELLMPVRGRVHRFVRSGGVEQVDVMVADHLAPRYRPRVSGREVFAVPAGTSALRRTVDCLIEIDGVSTKLSVPDVLGALVLEGAAYLEDPRDRGRHLDDAVVLACAIENPVTDRVRMRGSDRPGPSVGGGVGRSGSSFVAVDARATPAARACCVAAAGSGAVDNSCSAATKDTIARQLCRRRLCRARAWGRLRNPST